MQNAECRMHNCQSWRNCFFPTSIVRKNLLLNISITSFSQYTTICFVSFFFIRFSMNICVGFCHFLCTESNQRNFIMRFLVGPSGLEPPTSCLSGTRSNLLSYEPMWLVSDFLFHLDLANSEQLKLFIIHYSSFTVHRSSSSFLVEMMGFDSRANCALSHSRL